MGSVQSGFAATVFCCLALQGCAAFSPSDLAKPTSLSVEEALSDVGRGFAGMKHELRRSDLKLGLYPCKVTVNLNVTASAEQGGKLVLDASTAPTTTTTTALVNTVSASGHVEQVNSSSASRGNTVVVEMYSVACTPKDTLAGTHPEKISAVTSELNSGLVSAPLTIKKGK
ncbi:UNVERIFIED_ORG: hypothetical protein GGI57_005278 [Rhizobium aethiopicum]